MPSNACGLYVQTHGKSRPTSHFGGRKPRNKEGGASRDTTPAGTPRNSPGPGAPSSSDASSSELETSPKFNHAIPEVFERQSRAPRRPHQVALEAQTSSSRSHSRPRAHLSRPPPRPRSAPPSKHKSRFHTSHSIDIFRADTPPAPGTKADVERLRRRPDWEKDLITREQATDVLSGGKWYRVPEKTIRLDFWSKIGLDPNGSKAGAVGHGGTSMMRTSSLPLYTPRNLTPEGVDSPATSPVAAMFPADHGGFSDSENAYGKRERYAGEGYGRGYGASSSNRSGYLSSDSGLDGHIGGMRLAGSTPDKARPHSLSPVTSPLVPHSAVQRPHSPLPVSSSHYYRQAPQSSPLDISFHLPSSSMLPSTSVDVFIPHTSGYPYKTQRAEEIDHPAHQSIFGSTAIASPTASFSYKDEKESRSSHESKRFRSSSPDVPISPTLAHSATVNSSGSSALFAGNQHVSSGLQPTSPLLQHPSPIIHHAVIAQSIPRASSPLRFSSRPVESGTIPKSLLGNVRAGEDGPSAPSDAQGKYQAGPVEASTTEAGEDREAARILMGSTEKA